MFHILKHDIVFQFRDFHCRMWFSIIFLMNKRVCHFLSRKSLIENHEFLIINIDEIVCRNSFFIFEKSIFIAERCDFFQRHCTNIFFLLIEIWQTWIVQNVSKMILEADFEFLHRKTKQSSWKCVENNLFFSKIDNAIITITKSSFRSFHVILRNRQLILKLIVDYYVV